MYSFRNQTQRGFAQNFSLLVYLTTYVLFTQAEYGTYLRNSSRFPRRRPFIYLKRHTSSGQPRVYRVTQLYRMSHRILVPVIGCGLLRFVVANYADWPPLVGICPSIQKDHRRHRRRRHRRCGRGVVEALVFFWTVPGQAGAYIYAPIIPI